jgi:hypothetical protein
MQPKHRVSLRDVLAANGTALLLMPKISQAKVSENA